MTASFTNNSGWCSIHTVFILMSLFIFQIPKIIAFITSFFIYEFIVMFWTTETVNSIYSWFYCKILSSSLLRGQSHIIFYFFQFLFVHIVDTSKCINESFEFAYSVLICLVFTWVVIVLLLTYSDYVFDLCFFNNCNMRKQRWYDNDENEFSIKKYSIFNLNFKTNKIVVHIFILDFLHDIAPYPCKILRYRFTISYIRV